MEEESLLIVNAQVFLTYRQCFAPRSILLRGERIAAVLPADARVPGVRKFDAEGMYVIPGLVDVHMHIESSMTHPREFSRWALRYGTTAVVADAHEIVNVFGMEGQKAFMAQDTDLDIFWAIPSSVPSTSMKLETSGAEMTLRDVREMLKSRQVVSLGEVMNKKDLLSPQETQIQKFIALCRRQRGRDIRIEGHCPKISGEELNAFIAAGVDADHTLQTPESLLEKSDLGMFLELQDKSLTRQNIRTIRKYSLYENIALVTDDVVPDRLTQGQLNAVVRHAVELGMPLEKAIYCATFTGARRMHLDERGMIAPGRIADLVFFRQIRTFVPDLVFKSGRKVYDSCKPHLKPAGKPQFPASFYHSIHCRLAGKSDFVLHTANPGARQVTVNVLVEQPGSTATACEQRTLPVKNGIIQWEDSDLCLTAVYERHGRNGNVAFGLLANAFTEKGAASASWSHDCHNVIVVGSDAADMQKAQNRVVKEQGGYVVCTHGKITAEAPLHIAGIISDEPMEKLGRQIAEVRSQMEALGWHNANVIMNLSTLALPVSPAVKMTDYGYLDVRTQKTLPLIVREE